MTTNQDLFTYKPKKRFLSILSLGDKQALLTYGNLIYYGKWAWETKYIIDLKFINEHKSMGPVL
jgi:NADH dehydrogenase FAD-containing subunit